MLHSIQLFAIGVLLLCSSWSVAWSQTWSDPIPYDVTVSGTPAPGYIFMSPRSDDISNPYPSQLMMLDSAGGLVWYAPIGNDQNPPFTGPPITDFKVLANGQMTYWTPRGTRFWYLMDSTFAYVDSIACQGIGSTDEHDLIVDEKGHYYLICDSLDVRDASALMTRDSISGSASCTVEQQIIQGLDPNRNIVSEWYTLDHYALSDVNPLHWSNAGFMDHSHVNSIHVDPNGFTTISSRNVNEITRFNQQTGEVVWRFGGEGNQFTILGDSVEFNSQHDARYTPEGNLYLFDNARHGDLNVARYVEYDLDTAAMTATLVREIRHPDNKLSWYMGNSEHLPNDHVIINWGSESSLNGTTNMTEFDADGNIVLDLNFEGEYFSYRVKKAPVPWRVNRPEITCDGSLGTLEAPTGYDSYQWSNGDTSRAITVASPGTYQVWVNEGVGYMSSVPVTVTDPLDVCLALASPSEQDLRLDIYPNPTERLLNVGIPPGSGKWTLTLYDGLGRVQMRRNGRVPRTENLDLGGFEAGIYYLQVERNGKLYREKVLHY